jgi:hypothetical protein
MTDYTGADSYTAGGRRYTVVYGVSANGGNGMQIRDPSLPQVWYPGSTYKSKYHTNERMAQVLMTGPRVPHCILFCIKAHYFLSAPGTYPRLADLKKQDIARICKNTPVPRTIQYAYRSGKFPHEPMRDYTQYSERWYFILVALGREFTIPEDHEADRLKYFCQQAQSHWGTVRHVEACDSPNTDCHRRYGCRKNFPNLYYVMAQLCIMLGMRHLLPCFPVNNQTKTLKDLDRYWKLLCEHLDWPFHPWGKKCPPNSVFPSRGSP